MTWQTIETAPKDGALVLGYADDSIAVVLFNHGYWQLSECGTHADDAEWNPTHWMPLPSPPTTEGE